MLRSFFLGLLLVGAVGAQEMPKFKQPLPPRAQILKLGWDGFQTWCMDNLDPWGEAQVDEMARNYRDWRDGANAEDAANLTGKDLIQLDTAVKAVNRWQQSRYAVAGLHKGGSIYSHLGPRREAALADVRYRCLMDWKVRTPLQDVWPKSYQALAKKPIQANGELKRRLIEEGALLRQAIDKVKQLPSGPRWPLQRFLLKVGEINPNSRG
jgi:hypothetical protein